MSVSLAKYHARSPRYVLNTQDNSLVRFSGAERLAWEEKTDLLTISLSGLSFTAPIDLSPQLGEIIKIQFEVPGSEMMACYAIITRIQYFEENVNEVAVHFYKLDRIQRINLVQGLAKKLDSKINRIHTEPAPKNTPLHEKEFVFYFTLMFISLMCWIVSLKILWSVD